MTVERLHWTAWLPRRRFFVACDVEEADQVPRRLPRHAAVIVRRRGSPTWIAFDCPCRRRHRLLVNLDPSRKPYWRMLPSKRLSLAPSVDVVDGGRRCHFWIRDGRTSWPRTATLTRWR
ncbi:MAG: DUF6527 family protein [Actinomycetota bacterium]